MLYRLASGLFWFLFSPSNLLIFLAVIGAAMLFTRAWRRGRNLLVGVAAAYLVGGFGPVGAILMRPLEDRFPRPPDSMPAPAGIIVLGGAFIAEISSDRDAVTLAEEGGRMTESAILARRYPHARVVFSGGTRDATDEERDEAHVAARFFEKLGVARERILLEDRSLNTEENARFTRELVRPRADERWLLVTSAAHVPRAIAAFRHAGFDAVPYPTDYLTTGKSPDFWEFRSNPSRGLNTLDGALHEWIGLIAYRLMGATDDFFPGPNP
jgi:uncharacterized SAM-binding protein YcdF (DUF218 family)